MKNSICFLLVTCTFLLFSSKEALSYGHGFSKKKKKKKIEKIIGTAKGYIGTKYKYGGTSKAGMDCSGLMLRSFKAVDIDLPRTSSDQSKVGKSVSISNLQKGDLVFFALGKKKKKITHVGLVTSTKSSKEIRFIHASSSRGVVESDLMKDYYRKHIVKCRRVL